ncbi:MAG: Nramp family divalent metal transporter [Verrucomicrobiota bacterium]|nr:Nramp family divalent metal transporter [Verrucomicrobiota bacterium]
MSTTGPQDAPTHWRGILRHLGPGLIITACIVGSGELIATPMVGAEYGFSLLWFIIGGCMIKVLVQVELGRFAISKGMTTLEAMNTIPGPRWVVSWLVWCWLFMFVGILFQLGGIVGGVGQVVAELGWFGEGGGTGIFTMDRLIAVGVSAATVAILASGKYKPVEVFSTIVVVLFMLATLFALGSLQWSPEMAAHSISWGDIREGFQFRLPGDFSTAFAAFGIIGVGASELIYYPYWCLEKGYARNVGTPNPTNVWYRRTQGWLRVMRIDACVSMVVYTGATVAFFLLGAALLHGSSGVSNETMIADLSKMYAPLGEAGLTVFLLGAFMVLFSTMVTASASNARLLADGLVLFQLKKPRNEKERAKLLSQCCIVVPMVCAGVYLFVGAPVSLVLVGGVAQALMLPFLAGAALYFRYKQTDKPLQPGKAWTALLWISAIAMAAVGLFQFYQKMT